ncbi:hypothetical protein TWF730_002271 [Orbilia blumenaviensis]|uniref:F-box domain-containing protein n=1 Tax=Orbilia blumenaviensis TaxID=1796055 RepID=A0AAV9UDT9_9PEZI
MSSPTQKSSLENLPLEIKIEIFEALDSVYDLEALRTTCSTFYNILESPHNVGSVYLDLILRGKVGEVLYTLSVFRTFGRDGRIRPMENEIASMAPTEKSKYLQELYEYRKTARWFSNLFFATRAHKYGDPIPDSNSKLFVPSRTENMKLDETFLLIWLLAEIAFMSSKPETDSYKAFEEVVEDLISRVVVRCEAEVAADFGVMYGAGMMILELLTPIVLRYAKTVNPQQVAELGDPVGCLDCYHKTGIPSLILSKRGLNGYQKLLMADESVQHSVIEEYYQTELINRSDNFPEFYKTPLFISFLDRVELSDEDQDKADKVISSRPLAKRSTVALRNEIPSQDATKVFDIDAMFCDDDRLKSLGYFSIEDESENWGSEWPSTFEEQLESDPCHCLDEWACPKRYELWKDKTKYDGESEDAPVWGVHFQRRNSNSSSYYAAMGQRAQL